MERNLLDRVSRVHEAEDRLLATEPHTAECATPNARPYERAPTTGWRVATYGIATTSPRRSRPDHADLPRPAGFT